MISLKMIGFCLKEWFSVKGMIFTKTNGFYSKEGRLLTVVIAYTEKNDFH